MRRLRKWFAYTKAKGYGGQPVFYDRLRHDGFGATRQYHVFGLVKVVTGTGESFWRLVIGSHAFAFGYQDRRALSRACLLQDDPAALPNVDEPVPAIAERTDEVDAEAINAGLDSGGGNVGAALDAKPVHDRSPESDQISIGAVHEMGSRK